MALWKKEVRVPQGFEAVVNGQIDRRKPLRVGKYDQLYFVNFAPTFLRDKGEEEKVLVEATSKEGLMHKLAAQIRLEFQRDRLSEILPQGDSNYRDTIRVSIGEYAKQQNLLQSVKACIATYVHETGFFDLAEQESHRKLLNDRISQECEKAKLVGELIACDIVPMEPDPTDMARLMEEAKSDTDLGRVVDYFRHMFEQSELLKTQKRQVEAEAEKARLEIDKETDIAKAKTRADVKIAEANEESRVRKDEISLQREEADLQEEVQKRNAEIKENAAQLEFEYKQKRLDEEMRLAQKEAEIVKAKDAEEEALRERKRLDMQLELEQEGKMANIRTEEKASLLMQLGNLIEKLAKMPATDYSGVHTLITSAGLERMDPKEFTTGLVLGLLSRTAGGVGFSNDVTRAEGEEKELTLATSDK